MRFDAFMSGFFFRPRQKKLKDEKTQNSSKKLKDSAFWCNLQQKSTEMTNKQGGNY